MIDSVYHLLNYSEIMILVYKAQEHAKLVAKKRDKVLDKPCILSFFLNSFNKFNNT